MTHEEKAESLFMSGLNCAQAVFGAFAEDFAINDELAAKISSGFGGGVGRLREVCGAVTGATLALGLKFGPDKAVVYPKVQAFAAAFKAETGSLVCRDLLAGTAATTGGAPEARTPAYYAKRPCVKLVKLAVRKVEEVMAE